MRPISVSVYKDKQEYTVKLSLNQVGDQELQHNYVQLEDGVQGTALQEL